MVFACSRNELVLLVLQVHGSESESVFVNGEGFVSAFAVEDETLFRSSMGSLASVATRIKGTIIIVFMVSRVPISFSK